MALRIYLDTSILSALDDARAPERRDLTREFWRTRDLHEVLTSELTRQEIDSTPDEARRAQMLAHLAEVRLLRISEAARDLVRRYIDAGAFAPSMEDDALHVAIAVDARCDALLSWNFRHLVNRRRRAAANAVNLAAGRPTIDIITPPEL